MDSATGASGSETRDATLPSSGDSRELFHFRGGDVSCCGTELCAGEKSCVEKLSQKMGEVDREKLEKWLRQKHVYNTTDGFGWMNMYFICWRRPWRGREKHNSLMDWNKTSLVCARRGLQCASAAEVRHSAQCWQLHQGVTICAECFVHALNF